MYKCSWDNCEAALGSKPQDMNLKIPVMMVVSGTLSRTDLVI